MTENKTVAKTGNPPSLFSGMFGGGESSNPVDALKQLLNIEDIELKTDLNIQQVKVLTQLYWFSLIKDPANEKVSTQELVQQTMLYYMKLSCSIDRKREKAIVDALSKMNPELFTAMQSPFEQSARSK